MNYPKTAALEKRTITLTAPSSTSQRRAGITPKIAVLGAGNYASRQLIPALVKAGAHLHSIVAPSGVAPVHVGRRFRFQQASTDIEACLADPAINTVVIATRHDSHALLIQKALAAGKHVFVEKPLCLSGAELQAIQSAYASHKASIGEGLLLMVGFNRRFAPLLVDLKQELSRLQGPKAFVYTCNAGAIPADHWTQNPAVGGGRLLGEACHFVDLLRYLAASPIEDLQLFAAADRKPSPDTFSLQLRFTNGSIGTVHYFASGSKTFPKERLEVFAAGKVLQLDNFRKLRAWGLPGFRTRRLLNQDKGQLACCVAFLNAIETGDLEVIPAAELFEVQHWLLQALPV